MGRKPGLASSKCRAQSIVGRLHVAIVANGTVGVPCHKIQWLRVGCLSMCTVAVDNTAIKSLPGRGCSMGMYVKYCKCDASPCLHTHLQTYLHIRALQFFFPRNQVGNTNTNRTTRREPGTENMDRPRTGREHRGGRTGRDVRRIMSDVRSEMQRVREGFSLPG